MINREKLDYISKVCLMLMYISFTLLALQTMLKPRQQVHVVPVVPIGCELEPGDYARVDTSDCLPEHTNLDGSCG